MWRFCLIIAGWVQSLVSSVVVNCNCNCEIILQKTINDFALLISVVNLRLLRWTKLWTTSPRLSHRCWTRRMLEAVKAEAGWDLGSDEHVMSSPARTACQAMISCPHPLRPSPPPTTQALYVVPTLHSAPPPVRTRAAESWTQMSAHLQKMCDDNWRTC